MNMNLYTLFRMCLWFVDLQKMDNILATIAGDL